MKALFKLKKSFDKPSINTILHIFDHTITPILLYGSEIWGIFSSQKFKAKPDKYLTKETDAIPMERIHTKFCKFALGKSSNLASRGELGRYPLLPYILLNMIKCWCRLKEHSTDNNILANAFELSNAMYLENKISWVRNIKEIFDYLEMSYLFNNSARYTSDTIIRQVKEIFINKV